MKGLYGFWNGLESATRQLKSESEPITHNLGDKQLFDEFAVDTIVIHFHFRLKIGHLYKAVFDEGCCDDVSIDAAIIKVQSRLPEKAEFIETETPRLKSAGKLYHFMYRNWLRVILIR